LALLEVRDVTVCLGGHTALRGVSLSVEAGRVTGLIGPEGAGKTTLFDVITGLLTPAVGTVLLDGVDVTRLAPHRRARRGVARAFERLEPFGQLSVLENVQLAARLRRRATPWGQSRAGDPGGTREVDPGVLLDRVGLAPFADRRADTLTPGLERRLELARALAVRPRVLLIDEPPCGQRERDTVSFAGLLGELAGEGLAILLVNHDLKLVLGVCSHLYVLDAGSLTAAGDPASVCADPRVWEASRAARPDGVAPATAGAAGGPRGER
jgi:branched-chain amino acid transport system ATP-binding protein